MRDFTGIKNEELAEKIRSMAGSELGEALNELMKRQINSYREDMDTVSTENGPQAVCLVQGRIQQLKDLRSLFQTQAVPRKGQQGEFK